MCRALSSLEGSGTATRPQRVSYTGGEVSEAGILEEQCGTKTVMEASKGGGRRPKVFLRALPPLYCPGPPSPVRPGSKTVFGCEDRGVTSAGGTEEWCSVDFSECRIEGRVGDPRRDESLPRGPRGPACVDFRASVWRRRGRSPVQDARR